jgi:hypothetical protein
MVEPACQHRGRAVVAAEVSRYLPLVGQGRSGLGLDGDGRERWQGLNPT